MRVSQAIKWLSEMDKDDFIYIAWWDREWLAEAIEGYHDINCELSKDDMAEIVNKVDHWDGRQFEDVVDSLVESGLEYLKEKEEN